MSRKCVAIGMEEMREEYKVGLLMTRVHLEDRDKSILLAALGGDVTYKKVKSTLLNVFNDREKGEVWMVDINQAPRCYTCQKIEHISRGCPENKRRNTGKCVDAVERRDTNGRGVDTPE